MGYIPVKLALFSVLVAVASAFCVDHFRCPWWVAEDFCYNSFYTEAEKAEFCPVSCNKCNVPSAATITTGMGTTAAGALFLLLWHVIAQLLK